MSTAALHTKSYLPLSVGNPYMVHSETNGFPCNNRISRAITLYRKHTGESAQKIEDELKCLTTTAEAPGFPGDDEHSKYLETYTHTVDEELALLDEVVREGELARLKARIQTAIDDYFEWGQFEVWWNNPSRTNRLYVPSENDIRTYWHNDYLLLRLLRNAELDREKDRAVFRKHGQHNFFVHGKTTAELAWLRLCQCFNEDRIREDWQRNEADWQPDDPTGPHRAR
jgi:hypothetical protein